MGSSSEFDDSFALKKPTLLSTLAGPDADASNLIAEVEEEQTGVRSPEEALLVTPLNLKGGAPWFDCVSYQKKLEVGMSASCIRV